MHQHAILEDTVYFWVGANDTGGSGADADSGDLNWDVRLAGAAGDAVPVLSGTGTLLSHANYPAGCYEIAVAATAVNGFAAGNTYGVFATVLVDSQNPTGFAGSFKLGGIPAALTNAAHGGAAATLSLKSIAVSNADGDAVSVASSGTNGSGLVCAGNGSGHGISITAGATGNGLHVLGGATSGDGIHTEGPTLGHGICGVGIGTLKDGLHLEGYTGLWAESTATNGVGLLALGNGSNGAGLLGRCDDGFGIDAYSDSAAGIGFRVRNNQGVAVQCSGKTVGLDINASAGVGVDIDAAGGDGVNITSADDDGLVVTGTGIGKYDVIADIHGTIDTCTANTDMRGTESAALATDWTPVRAAYLDNLNIGGNVASSVEATAIQNNTRCVRVVPSVVERPDSGTTTYRIELLLYDETGNMEAPDSAPTITLVNQAGTDLSARLDSATMSLVSTGCYRAVYTATNTDDLEQLVWTFSVVEGGATRLYGNTTIIVDTTAVDFTAADRSKVEALYNKLPSKSYLTGTANSDGDVQADEATGNFPGSVASVAGTVGSVTNPVTAGTVSDKAGYALTAAYDAAKTAAQPGADGDTLKTLSDQVDAIPTNPYTGTPPTADAIGTDAASKILATPANKLATDATGAVTTDGASRTASKADVSALATSEALAAAQTILNKLNGMLEADGLVFRFTTNALEQGPSGGGMVDQLWDTVVEVGTDGKVSVPFGHAIAYILSSLVGESSGQTSNAPQFQGANSSEVRIEATTTKDGRTSVTLTPPG